MKAVTICQPYAHLISRPWGEALAKRTENRTWPTRHRGLIVIHAGRSRAWLDTYEHIDAIHPKDLVFGAIVAVARLVACLAYEQVKALEYLPTGPLSWLAGHEHACGPWCWVLDQAVVPVLPVIPCRGAQGLWDITDDETLYRLHDLLRGTPLEARS